MTIKKIKKPKSRKEENKWRLHSGIHFSGNPESGFLDFRNSGIPEIRRSTEPTDFRNSGKPVFRIFDRKPGFLTGFPVFRNSGNADVGFTRFTPLWGFQKGENQGEGEFCSAQVAFLVMQLPIHQFTWS